MDFNELKDARGNKDVGDSGEELGDGSVRVESTVEIVVVGDDSAESDLREPRREGSVGRGWNVQRGEFTGWNCGDCKCGCRGNEVNCVFRPACPAPSA